MVLASGIVEGGGQRYWQRTCHELDKPVSFAGVKEGNERDVLVARVYVRGTESRGTRISVNLAFERSTGSVMASWTSRRTVLDLEAPLGRCRADCLAGGSEYVCERVFRIVLGSDVLPGPYMVTMQHEGGAECLLHLARRIEDDGVDPGWLAVTGQAGE
jgi:hypothetical protein